MLAINPYGYPLHGHSCVFPQRKPTGGFHVTMKIKKNDVWGTFERREVETYRPVVILYNIDTRVYNPHSGWWNSATFEATEDI